MEDVLYVWIKGYRYTLYSQNDVTWRLYYPFARDRLKINQAHSLAYWRRKGVIDGEETKKNKGS